MSVFEEDFVKPMRELVFELKARRDQLGEPEIHLLDNLECALFNWDHPNVPASSTFDPPGEKS